MAAVGLRGRGEVADDLLQSCVVDGGVTGLGHGGVAAGAPARPGDGGLAGPARGGLEDRPGSLQPFAREAAARGAAIERRDAEGLQSVSPDLDPGIAASEVVDELAQLRGRIAGAV